MKKVILYALLVLGPCFLLPTARAQHTEDIVPVVGLYNTINKLIPYYDQAHHFTITKATLNTDSRHLQLTIQLDKGLPHTDNQGVYLQYLASTPEWSLAPLAEYSYGLRLNITHEPTDENSLGRAYVTTQFTSKDIRNALAPPMVRQSRAYLSSYARQTHARLPYTTGPNEQFVACRYIEADSLFTMTLEYADKDWTDVKKYLLANSDNILHRRARALAADTAEGLAAALYIGDITLRYIHRNHRHSDSLSLDITPSMMEQAFKGIDAVVRAAAQGSPMRRLLQYVEEANRSKTSEGDTPYQFQGFRLDTASHLLESITKVPQVEKTRLANAGQEAVRQTLTDNTILSQEWYELMRRIVDAQVTLQFVYTSFDNGQPFTVTFTPDELKSLIRQVTHHRP